MISSLGADEGCAHLAYWGLVAEGSKVYESGMAGVHDLAHQYAMWEKTRAEPSDRWPRDCEERDSAQKEITDVARPLFEKCNVDFMAGLFRGWNTSARHRFLFRKTSDRSASWLLALDGSCHPR